MKKNILLLLLFISVMRLEAQTLQSKIIPFNGNPAVTGIEPWEDQFILSVISFIDDTVGSTFILLDSELSSIDEFEFRGFASNRGGAIVNNEDFFVFGNNHRQSQFVTLLKTKELFDQPQKFNYSTNSQNNFTNTSTLLNDHIYTLTVDEYSGFPERRESFLQKIDLEGNEIWNVTFHENQTYTNGVDLKPTENDNLLIGSSRIIEGSFYAEVIRVDQMGNKIWTYLSPEISVPGYSFHWTTELSNNNLINISTVDRKNDVDFIANEWSERPPKLTWLDSTGTVLYDTLLTSNQFLPYSYSGIKKGRGDYFFIYGDQFNSDFLAGSYGWLCKFSNDGELIWDRRYHDPELNNSGYFHNIRDMVEMENGDLITRGRALKPGENQQIWLMRINSDGCLDDDDVCGDISTATKDISHVENSINLFPNPSNGVVNLSLSDDLDSKLASISIIDMSGAISYQERFVSQDNIDLSHLPKGVYFVQFVFENGLSQYEKLVLI